MRNQMIRTAGILAVCVLGFTHALAAQVAALPPKSYVWYGEFVALDGATNTATLKVPIREHVARYATRFKAGDSLLLLWDMNGKMPRADHVQALWVPDPKAVAQPVGYILPITFVSVDLPSLTMTFTTTVPATELTRFKSAMPGQVIEATAPTDPRSH
jgi:hypothetical protein